MSLISLAKSWSTVVELKRIWKVQSFQNVILNPVIALYYTENNQVLVLPLFSFKERLSSLKRAFLANLQAIVIIWETNSWY